MILLILVVLMLILLVSLMNGFNKSCNFDKSARGIKHNMEMWKKIYNKLFNKKK